MDTALKQLAALVTTPARARDDGQTLVEYVLIVGLVSVMLIITLTLMAGSLDEAYQAITDAL